MIINSIINAAHADVLNTSSINATYNVTYRNIASGTLVQNLKLLPNQQYQFSQKISSQIAFFDFAESEESTGSWNADTQTIQPSNYVVTGRSRLEKYQFDWKNHIVHYQKEKKKGDVAMPEILYDQLSCQLVLRIALEKGTKELVCPYISGRKIKQLHFQIVGQETLSFENRNYPVQKIIQQNPAKPNSKKTIFWISKDLSFMPLRVIQYKDNQQISVATLTELQVRD